MQMHHTMTRPTLAVMAAAMLSLSPLASAQNLQELYDAARSYDAGFRAARASAESAEYRAAQAEALRRPSASVNANATGNLLDLPRTSGSSTSVGGSVSARYPLYNRTNDATYSQAQKSLALSRSDLVAAEQDLIIRLSQAYFDVLAAQDALTTTRAAKAAITEQLASAKRNFEVGTATITDTREAQARFDLATAQEIATENDLRTKGIALDQLVGRTNVAPKGLARPVLLPSTQPADAEAWVARSESVHPTIQKARLALDLAQLESEKARAGRLPTVDAVGSVGASDASGKLATTPGLSKSATVGVQLSWPIYTGGAVENRLKETIALEEKARNDLEAARRAVAQSTRQAYFGLQSGMAQVKALEAAEASSQLALEATQLGYRVGVRVNLDVLNAQTQLFTTQRDLAKARYDVVLANLRLRQASGLLKSEDLQPLNALLVR
jgi:outer membrane protein